MPKIPSSRTQLTFKELMERWEWNENDLREAVIHQGLVPSYFISGAIWQRPLDGAGARPRAEATSVYELMYLDNFHETSALDGYFDRCAREPDALIKGGDVFEVGGIGVEMGRVSLTDVFQKGVVVMAEIERFEKAERPLSKRERDTLLTIIAVICKEANLDFLKHAKTAGVLVGTAAQMGISIGETTIEGHLKRIPDALESRMK